MDKAEALGFIRLKEPFSEEAVRDKYMERFNYFQMLYSNAPNKVVEQIQQQNLEKLNRVKKLLLEEIAAKKKNFNKKYANPITKPKPEAADIEKKPIVGWLIVHTENKKAEMFDLYEGINYLGRKKKDDKANNILIEDDPFVSRTHAFIKCKEADGKVQYVLYDGDGNKPSVNGVFLNGNDDRIHQHCPLKENDTVQIGTTKLVFKVKKNHRSIAGELEEVMRTDFIRTIDIYK
ncbi:MAG: FHA domain-containing protein [Chitinophagaceae bacterium]